MKKPLLVLLFIALGLFAVDRIVGHLYLPKTGSNSVVIYSTTWCPYCTALRNTLEKYDIPFTEHDTEKSLQGLLGYWALRGRGVPVSVIGEQVIHGYDGQEITDALISAGYEIPLQWPIED